MTMLIQTYNEFWFVVLPYMALLLFFVGSVYRYLAQRFTYSSLSSQFLENEQHFWGLVPFHYGLLVVLLGHLLALFIPKGILLWNSHPLRLYALEITGLIFGLFALFGLTVAVGRRFQVSKVKRVTTPTDWVLLLLLLLQIGSGVHVAIAYSWGSSWFAAAMAPYLWSLAFFTPNPQYVAALPPAVQFHIINAFVLIGFFPFTRLAHVLVMPIPYLWRKPQLVRWYRRVPSSAKS